VFVAKKKDELFTKKLENKVPDGKIVKNKLLMSKKR